MYTKALILVLLGSTLVVCSPEAEPGFFRRRHGEPGPIRRVVQRTLNFTKRQGERIGRVVVGGAKEVIGVGKDVKDVAFGTIGDVKAVAAEKWGRLKNGTWGTIGAISHGLKDTKDAWFPPDNSDDSEEIPPDFLAQCLAIQKNGDLFQTATPDFNGFK